MAHGNANAIWSNPAALNQTDPGSLGLSYWAYYAGAKMGSFTYNDSIGKVGQIGFGAKYLSYGEFQGFDASGIATNSFDAKDLVLQGTYGRTVGPFSLGVQLKYIQSRIENYQASAIAIDFGGQFVHPENDLVFGWAIKNVGAVLGDYTPASETALPFDVSIGAAFKPQFMPFRFYVTARSLDDWELYSDENAPTADLRSEDETFEKIFQHMVLGTELLLGEYFTFRLGYNYRLRRELKLTETSGGAGFSFGLGVKLKQFEMNFSRLTYHASGGNTYLTLNFRPAEVFRKKSTVIQEIE
jgi:hypothetical protein